MATVCVKTISEIIGNEETRNRFIIPNYQRGYRWGKKNVTKLLNDLLNAYQTNREQKYCLQPISLRPGELNQEKFTETNLQGESKEYTIQCWETIDGQQRLTTLFLFLQYLKAFGVDRSLYQIEFALRRETTDKLKNWADSVAPRKTNEMNFDSSQDPLDIMYMSKAIGAFREWFSDQNPGNSILGQIGTFAEFIQENVIMLWHELDKDDDPIRVFCSLNTGKIPLTASELLKAYLLRINYRKLSDTVNEKAKPGDNGYNDLKAAIKKQFEKEQRSRAEKWDRMERRLSDEEFFRFLCGGTKEPESRMDLLFQILYFRKSDKTQAPSNEELFEYFEEGAITNSEEIWVSLCDSFDILSEWYADSITFHKIGFLTAFQDCPARLLGQLIAEYEQSDVKTDFNGGILDGKIKERLEETLRNTSIAELNYETSSHKEKIKELLLLFNVISAIKSKYYRFSFAGVYPLSKNASLEHIFPRHPDANILANDREGMEKFISAAETELKKYKKEPTPIDKQNCTKEEFSEWWERFIKEIWEDPADLQHIGNIALISKSMNSELQNEMFSGKQSKIREFDKDGKFIPLCTHNAFLKYYSISSTEPDRNGDAHSSTTLEIWTPEDIKCHFQSILACIEKYLPSDSLSPNTTTKVEAEVVHI